MEQQQEQRPEWLGSYPDEVQQQSTLYKFKAPEEALLGYVNLERKGGNSIPIPSEDAGPDARKEFTNRLVDRVPELMYKPDPSSDEQMGLYHETIGVPKDSAGYEAVAEGLEPDTLTRTKEMAHHAKLTKSQHEAVVSWLGTEAGEVTAAIEQARQADAEALSAQWGSMLDQRKQRVDTFLADLKVPEGAPEMGELNAAAYLRLDKVIEMLNGKGPQAFEQPGGTIGETLDEIEEKLNEIDTRLITEGAGMDMVTRQKLQRRKQDLYQKKAQFAA